MPTIAALDAGYQEFMLTPDGDVLPPIAWVEALGIQHGEVAAWAVEHLKGLLMARKAESAETSDGEMLLACCVDMFTAGLGLGLAHERGLLE